MWAILAGWFVTLGTSLIATIVSAGTGLVGSLVALFGTWRVMVYGLMVTVIGIEVYNLVCNIIKEVFDWLLGQLSGIGTPDGLAGSGMSVAGLAGYFAHHLLIANCLSFIFSAIVFKWIVVKIPFLKW